MPVNFERIRELREALTLTQQEAALRAGFKPEHAGMRWSDIEKQRNPDPRLSTLERIARVLGVGVCELILPDVPPAQKRKRPSGAAGSKG